MTRKNYNELAAAIAMVRRELREDYSDSLEAMDAASTAIHLLERELCSILKSDNARFDRDRFLTAAKG